MTTRRTFLSWLGTAMVALGVALPVRFGEEEPDDALPSWVNERPDQIFYLEPDKVPLKLLMDKLNENPPSKITYEIEWP